ncbi:MAG: magnesium chelatase family protein [Oceanicoccus sp.]|jgi:magnesium chelatase family protein
MPTSLNSYNLLGLHADPISVQVEVSKGMPHFAITGMASASIRESKDRLRSAIQHSGYRFPMTRKVIHLAPAETPKRGSHFDLAMALGLLAASGQIPPIPLNTMVVGELGLEGGVRSVRGLLPGLMQAKNTNVKSVILPQANHKEAALITGLNLYPVKSLTEAIEALKGKGEKLEIVLSKAKHHHSWTLDDINGHSHAKRALLLAAAGGHHVLMHGPPGTGKSLLARAFPSLLPSLQDTERLEVMQIYSVAALPLKNIRPFRKVHHSISRAQLLGGGPSGKPGELSLSHRGVLYLDELPEFKREVLESLRQPLEDGEYTLIRQQRSLVFPSQFQLIASMNPCPCGYHEDPQHPCQCMPHEIARYQKKLSGPLMDRLDIFIPVPRLSFQEINEKKGPRSVDLRNQVKKAHARQIQRQGKLNHELSSKEIKALNLNAGLTTLLETATDRLGLSGRAIHKTIKLALTIADLKEKKLEAGDVGEALTYRNN